MKKILFIPVLASLFFLQNTGNAQLTSTTWTNVSNGTWSTALNWNNGLPSNPNQLAVFNAGNGANRVLDLAGTARVAWGIRFDFAAGVNGFTFGSSANPGPGIYTRTPTNLVSAAILNNDDDTQLINVPVKLVSATGVQGAGAAQTWNAAAGNLVFNGTNQTGFGWTVNLNGASALTIDGAFNTTIGIASGGQIVNTNTGANGGLIKSGTGTLTLGGTLANTFIGVNIINSGKILAGKANALGSGNNLILNGGTFDTGGLLQSLGTLSLSNNATIDFGNGSSSLSFSNSSLLTWSSSDLNITNWTSGTDLFRFGTDATGLTPLQLSQIKFVDLSNAPGQIDSSGFITPAVVPEPATLAFGLLGGFGLLAGYLRRRS